jgi:hypothetical protein
VDPIHKTRVDKTAPARDRARSREEREIFLGDLMASILDFIGVASMPDRRFKRLRRGGHGTACLRQITAGRCLAAIAGLGGREIPPHLAAAELVLSDEPANSQMDLSESIAVCGLEKAAPDAGRQGVFEIGKHARSGQVAHQDLQDFIDRLNIEAVEGKSADDEIVGLCLSQLTNVGMVEVASDAPDLEVLAVEEAIQVPVEPGIRLVNIQSVSRAQGFEDPGGEDPGARARFQD